MVDDDEAERQIGVDLMEVLGRRVIEADGGASALKKAEGETIDVALLDYAMPKPYTEARLPEALRAALT